MFPVTGGKEDSEAEPMQNMQEGPWELGMQQNPPGVALNLCQGPVAQPAGSVIYGGADGLGNGPCCRGGFQRTWYEA